MVERRKFDSRKAGRKDGGSAKAGLESGHPSQDGHTSGCSVKPDHKVDYEVGRGKPPKHSQFKPGQSGNPAGRRKGLRNLKTDVKKILAMVVKIKEGGRTRNRSTQEAALGLLRQKVFQGDQRALDRFLELAARFNAEPMESEAAPSLEADDKAILAAYVAEASADALARVKPGDDHSDEAPRHE